MKKFLGLASIIATGFVHFTAGAGFYIDMQGVKPKKQAQSLGMEGYNLLTGKYYGLVHEIGSGIPMTIKSFGEDSTLADALFFILPNEWFAYVDERVEELPRVTWDASVGEGQPWVEVLAQMGKEFGLRFTLDWDQKLLQVHTIPNFTKPDFNDPIVITDSKNERQLFIYKKEPNLSGYLVKDGEYIPVKVTK
ncbi:MULTISPECIES: hypothetical protein [Alteromonas]|uniref:Uncharacterized protein n=1 Tax=Alteromonas macleodii TaxID=28108 RepID=A0AB36FPQ5_ALTMA|nr:hypothetical protein [Alteromonas macleodii]OES23868.1 hypothetical protein BFV95_4953 [Alteromonas macleodii]OES24573.1 hypothetical protein BFV94_4724 [Alteromonas macleodii]OES25584.1 hypothetical protein BFV93_4338 [Alteromonas macleodii]OES38992.1 hypothetical protein BFV96_4393 [Alteromonas macleodii]